MYKNKPTKHLLLFFVEQENIIHIQIEKVVDAKNNPARPIVINELKAVNTAAERIVMSL